MAQAIIQRLTAFANLDPQPEVERERALQEASAGDSCWAEWLHDLAAGRAIIASIDLVMDVCLDGSPKQFRAEPVSVWLEVFAHPPLVERQVQDAALLFVPDLEHSVRQRCGIDMAAGQLEGMCVHVDLATPIREQLGPLTALE